jgi:hypothetical protein
MSSYGAPAVVPLRQDRNPDFQNHCAMKRLCACVIFAVVTGVFPALAAPDPTVDSFLRELKLSREVGTTGNDVDYVVSRVQGQCYGLAVIGEDEGTVHWVEMLKRVRGRWIFVDLGGGSITGIPDIEPWARALGFPPQAARQLASVGSRSSTRVVACKAVHPKALDALWDKVGHRGEGPTVADAVLDSNRAPVFAATRTSHLEYSQDEVASRMSWWYQLFRWRAGKWSSVAQIHRLEWGFDVASWARRYGVPAAAAHRLDQLNDPTRIIQQ